jgi:hypothetical protein
MLRTISAVLFLGLATVGGVVAWNSATEHRRALEERDMKIDQQRAAIGRLTKSRRVAQAVVTRRWTDKDGKTWSHVRFVEVDEQGAEIARREADIEGEVVHFDALVLKFENEHVQQGDPVRGRSVLLFRRMYGEHLAPEKGIALDEAEEDGVPQAYRARDAVSDGERALWARFWELARNPEAARGEGVRVAQGEVAYTRLEEGMLYELTLDDAGGLNVRPTRLPAALLPER